MWKTFSCETLIHNTIIMENTNKTATSYSASFDEESRKAKKTRKIEIIYDFNDVSDNEKHELAVKTLNIRHKSWIVSDAIDAEHFASMEIDKNVSVRMLLDRAKSRESLPPAKVASRNIDKINDAETLAQMIVTIEAKLKGLKW